MRLLRSRKKLIIIIGNKLAASAEVALKAMHNNLVDTYVRKRNCAIHNLYSQNGYGQGEVCVAVDPAAQSTPP